MKRREFITLLSGAFSLFLCVSAAAQEGYYGVGHDKWHQGFYSQLRRNDGGSCCNLMDCRPTQSRIVGDHYEVKVDGVWTPVPYDKIKPAFAQKAEIEAVNAKWIDFFNKGDFAGVASLYTEDATAFPPGSGMVKGRTAIEVLWKSMAEQVLDVTPLGPSAAREIGTFNLKTKGPTPQEVTGKYLVVWEKIGSDWKLAVDI
jgi:ketosteroid isomerase-like protein